MRQISEADKRNAEKVDECNRNMEIQVTQLTDGLAGMRDMVEPGVVPLDSKDLRRAPAARA